MALFSDVHNLTALCMLRSPTVNTEWTKYDSKTAIYWYIPTCSVLPIVVTGGPAGADICVAVAKKRTFFSCMF